MIILLIGPSGAGKTTLGQYVYENLKGFYFEDLDDAIARRWHTDTAKQYYDKMGTELFFKASVEEVDFISQKYKESDKVIIAVGSGTLFHPKAFNWIHGYINISLIASAAETYPRHILANKISYIQHVNMEYNHNRQRLYGSSFYKVNISGLRLDESKTKFLAFIKLYFKK